MSLFFYIKSVQFGLKRNTPANNYYDGIRELTDTKTFRDLVNKGNLLHGGGVIQ